MTNLSSLGQAWLLEAYTNDTLKGNFHFGTTEQQICKSKEGLAYLMCKFKAAFCAKTFGQPSYVITVFSSTVLHCKAKRDKTAFLKSFLHMYLDMK